MDKHRYNNLSVSAMYQRLSRYGNSLPLAASFARRYRYLRAIFLFPLRTLRLCGEFTMFTWDLMVKMIPIKRRLLK